MALGDLSQRSWIQKYVNTRTLLIPYGIGDNEIDETIVYSAAQNYYVNNEGNLAKFVTDEDRKTYKDRTILALFSYDGKEAKLNLPENKVRDIYIAFRNAARGIQSSIKGTISDNDKAMWQTNIYGLLLMQYKSWAPALLFERFGKVKYDSNTRTVYMGKYTALKQSIGTKQYNKTDGMLQTKDFIFKIVLPKIGELILHLASLHTIGGYFKGYKMKDDGTRQMMFQKFLAENPQYSDKITYAEYEDIVKRQIRSAIVELRLLLGLSAMLMMAMGDWDDDGERDFNKYLVTRKLASIFLKTSQELSFAWDINSFTKTIANPLPMLSLVSDAKKTIISSLAVIYNRTLGEVPEGDDPNKDIKQAAGKWIGWAPPGQSILRLLDLMNNSVQYENVGR